MRKPEKIRMFFGLLLTTIFLFPSLAQLSHLSDDHEHAVCFDHSEHIHKSSYKCSIQDFHITPFDFDPLFDSPQQYSLIIDSSESHYYFLSDKTPHNTTKSLRAPPFLS